MPNMGRMATDKTTMPMPPNHWVRLRQNSNSGGKASTLLRMLLPVVVKPDMVSKNASVNEGIWPPR